MNTMSLKISIVFFFRFGVVDSSLLMISLLAGVSIDAVIARRIGARGYGPVIGAGLGNAASDFIAGLPEGKWASLGVGTGALLPMIPLVTAMAFRMELSGRTSYIVGGSSAILCAGTFIHSWSRRKEKHHH